jgi:hypothetical protein
MSVHLCTPQEQYHYHPLHLQPEALLLTKTAFVFPLLSLQESPVRKSSHLNLDQTSKLKELQSFLTHNHQTETKGETNTTK